MRIGEQIKKYRAMRSMSLTKLSEASGVQIATLSRIENGKMTGTLASHMSIAEALGVEFTELYRNAETAAQPPQEDLLEIVTSLDGKISREILARNLSNHKMLPTLIKIAPETSAPAESFSLGSERFIYVLEGNINLAVNGRTAELEPGMSLLFNANATHSISNNTTAPARILSVTTPVNL